MGSAHPVERKAIEYDNPLTAIEQPKEPLMVEIMFHACLNDTGDHVTFVPDPWMIAPSGSGVRDKEVVNPFRQLRDKYEEGGQTVCIEFVHIHQMKNGCNVAVEVIVDKFFSLPRGHKHTAAAEIDVVGNDSHTDDTNQLRFSLPANVNTFIGCGICVYKKQLAEGQYMKWAGMDEAFKEKRKVETTAPTEDREGQDMTISLIAKDLSGDESRYEVLKDGNPVVRALRAYMPECENSWNSTEICDDGKAGNTKTSFHSIPVEFTQEIRARMRNTFFSKRRYTTFNQTEVSLFIEPDDQRALDDMWLNKLRSNFCKARPIVQVIMSLSAVLFGEGDGAMNVIQLVLN